MKSPQLSNSRSSLRMTLDDKCTFRPGMINVDSNKNLSTYTFKKEETEETQRTIDTLESARPFKLIQNTGPNDIYLDTT
jgi:hypothetical protein